MTLLTRIDPAKRMDRWYAVSAQPTLFDRHAVVCAWGSRRTAYQRTCIPSAPLRAGLPAESRKAARELADEIVARKVKRGYALVTG